MSLGGTAKLILYLANGTQHEAKCDSRPEPAVLKYAASALKVEHMSAVQLKKEAQGAKTHIDQQTNEHSCDVMHSSARSSRVTCTAGAAERASVKQIMHMSSASCFRQRVLLSQPCRQGRQLSSFFTPPQGCPHG